ncbi:uncharacterized protein LOC131939832 [Physella acuta]|uniref:uncharacterized protein LOC131939832 n=1 Tax=Physella acuta TaxID=109671 RepID=UPI0027DD2DE5|nr:uncharacterized protein LOC131939832 [Physella acuta]
MSCPMDQFYDATSRRCQTVSNRTVVCEMTNRFECDVNRNGPVKTEACAGYAPDPFGNPCKYQYQGISLSVAPGTEWNQTKCSLDFSKTDRCYNTLVALDRDFLGNGSSNVCNAVFLANFDNGSKTVLSERLNKALDVYSIQQEVRLENNALTFTPDMSNAFLYYFFFNNKDMASNTAFRARVRLDNPQLNREYDIFSNSYCSQCPDTIRLTVSATSSTKRVVTAMFVTTGNSSVQTSAIIDLRNANDMMDITVVFGDNAIYGKVKEVSGSNVNSVIQAVDFSRVGKTAGSHIAINKCGIQLGRGPNNHFVGLIDQFAVYESCQDIDSVLR